MTCDDPFFTYFPYIPQEDMVSVGVENGQYVVESFFRPDVWYAPLVRLARKCRYDMEMEIRRRRKEKEDEREDKETS